MRKIDQLRKKYIDNWIHSPRTKNGILKVIKIRYDNFRRIYDFECRVLNFTATYADPLNTVIAGTTQYFMFDPKTTKFELVPEKTVKHKLKLAHQILSELA